MGVASGERDGLAAAAGYGPYGAPDPDSRWAPPGLAPDGPGQGHGPPGGTPPGHADTRPVAFGYRGEAHIGDALHLRARDHDPDTAAFTTIDPLEGIPGEPTEANPYHYAAGDPLNRTDPLGLSPFTDTAIRSGSVAAGHRLLIPELDPARGVAAANQPAGSRAQPPAAAVPGWAGVAGGIGTGLSLASALPKALRAVSTYGAEGSALLRQGSGVGSRMLAQFRGDALSAQAARALKAAHDNSRFIRAAVGRALPVAGSALTLAGHIADGEQFGRAAAMTAGTAGFGMGATYTGTLVGCALGGPIGCAVGAGAGVIVGVVGGGTAGDVAGRIYDNAKGAASSAARGIGRGARNAAQRIGSLFNG